MDSFAGCGHRKELAGTIVSRDLGEGNLLVSLVLVNPNDLHPAKPTPSDRELSHVRALLFEALALVGDDALASADPLLMECFQEQADLTLAPKPPRCSITRVEGRQRAWDRLESGDAVNMTLNDFKVRLHEGNLVSFLAGSLRLPYGAGAGVR